MTFMDGVRERVKGRGVRVVLPEGAEERAQRAAVLLRDGDLARPTLLGSEQEVRARAREWGLTLDGIEVRDPRTDGSSAGFATTYHELRRHKGLTPEAAR